LCEYYSRIARDIQERIHRMKCDRAVLLSRLF
jgi:hypothetical protein